MENMEIEQYVDKTRKSIGSIGDYAEARLESTTVKNFSMKNGVVLSAASFEQQGVGVRFLDSNSLSFCSTDNFNNLPKVLNSAGQMAKKAISKTEAYTLSQEDAFKVSHEVVQKEPVESVSVEKCIELLKSIDANLAEQKVLSRFLSLELEYIEKIYINSQGSEIKTRFPRVNLHYLFTTENNQRFWQKGACKGFEVFREWNLEETIPQEAKDIAAASQNAQRVTGKTDLVVSPEIAGIIAHESCGHPYEADRILGREAAQAGESFLKLEMRGTKFSNECVSIIDDPTLKGSYGYFEFDDEGTRAKPKKLIDKGKVNTLLSDRINAAFLNEKSSGNSRASAFNREPLIRMSNTFFEPGTKTEEELFEEVKNGVYIKRFMEWNIDDMRFNQKYVACEAYKIENGKLTTPVSNPVIEITTPQLYASITDVANNLEFHAASCGKGEPMQGMPVYMGGPSLLIRNIHLK